MAKAFNKTNGKAVKSAEAYSYKDGENVVRIFGGILPRYMYWVKSKDGKDIPLECLSFDREQEKFTNKEVDHVPTYFPAAKCSWSYAVNCIAGDKTVVLNLKKKLFLQVLSAAEDLGLDPTNPDEGFDLIFKRTKTGAMAFNVEYNLSVLKLKKRALTESERALIAECPPIDEKLPRPTAEDILKSIKRITQGPDEEGTDSDDSNVDHEAVADL